MTFPALFTGLALALAAAVAQPAPSRAACHGPQTADPGFYAVPLAMAGEGLEHDAQRVWTDWNLWNPLSPNKTTIWQGALPACGGQVIVSQIINRQCSSAVECPVRVVLRTPQQDRVLLDYEQACVLHQAVELRGDLGALRVCGRSFPLDPAAAR